MNFIEEVYQEQAATKRLQQRSHNSRPASKKNTSNKNVSLENVLAVLDEKEKALALSDHTTNNTDLESLDQQIKSMMTFSENAAPYGQKGKARICKVCGKEGRMTDIMKHMEVHHIAGIAVPCSLCGRIFKTRDALRQHKSGHHKNQ